MNPVNGNSIRHYFNFIKQLCQLLVVSSALSDNFSKMGDNLPAKRKTKPRDPFDGSAIEKIPIVTNTTPIINNVTAAKTVRQFSRIFG